LVAVGRELAELGIQLQAAEAFAHAVAAHRRAGDMGAAAHARLLADGALARCEGVATVGLRAMDGFVGLTEREGEVAMLAAAGRPNQAIAAELGISVRTAETHLQRAFAKLGVHRRSELAARLGGPSERAASPEVPEIG
jgi:DNA-binding CsgD family transcriptional regulator